MVTVIIVPHFIIRAIPREALSRAERGAIKFPGTSLRPCLPTHPPAGPGTSRLGFHFGKLAAENSTTTQLATKAEGQAMAKLN